MLNDPELVCQAFHIWKHGINALFETLGLHRFVKSATAAGMVDLVERAE
jgi:hypothetical protein